MTIDVDIELPEFEIIVSKQKVYHDTVLVLHAIPGGQALVSNYNGNLKVLVAVVHGRNYCHKDVSDWYFQGSVGKQVRMKMFGDEMSNLKLFERKILPSFLEADFNIIKKGA